jgi:hypothetical protein
MRRYDSAMRRRGQRNGRERGCWVFIPAEELEKAGYPPADGVPFYRTWGAARGRCLVQFYKTQ